MRAYVIKYDCFYYIFGINASFTIKHSLMVDHHNAKHVVKIFVSCVQCQVSKQLGVSRPFIQYGYTRASSVARFTVKFQNYFI